MKLLKTSILFFLLIGFSTPTQAQFWKKIKKRLEKKAEDKVLNKIDREADKTIDNTLDGDGKKKSTTKKKGEKKEKVTSQKKERKAVKKASFKAYSKFDFTPGEKIIAFEDFSQDEIGDLPARWNSTNSAEIVSMNNHKGSWMQIGIGKGSYVPEFITEFPDNFTLEYDVVFDYDLSKYSSNRSLYVVFSDVENPAYQLNEKTPGKNGFSFAMSGGISQNGSISYQKYTSDSNLNINGDKKIAEFNIKTSARGKKLHISIWKQKTRMRVYINEKKVFDVPRGFEKGVQLNNVKFYAEMSDEDSYYYISNLRYAVGKPDMRSKLLTEGKLVTYGITFDVNSAKIKASSYGTLKKIARVLTQNPHVKVKIVGHTDADGKDDANLSLSKKRAEAVKTMLVNEFSVDASQLSSEGKGESELLDTGSSLESKAKNRRVEFIKI